MYIEEHLAAKESNIWWLVENKTELKGVWIFYLHYTYVRHICVVCTSSLCCPQVSKSYCKFEIALLLIEVKIKNQSFFVSLLSSLTVTSFCSYDNHKIEKLLEGSWSVFWIKMASCWVCLILYMWTLIAPMVCPKRFEA